MSTLTTEPFAPLLDRLFTEARAPDAPDRRTALLDIPAPERRRLATSTQPEEWQRFYSLANQEYLAVSRETAQLLYMLVRAIRPQTIVEFGTSFGLSTLYLAAGLKDNGGTGRVITSEFEPHKAAGARANFAAAGLADLIELREGDALTTLGTELPETVDLVVLDGAKGLYSAVLDRLEPHLTPATLVLADDADRCPPYLERVRGAGWVSVPFAEDIELSLRTGR
jgi:predicted O-methyltransferase YrrM